MRSFTRLAAVAAATFALAAGALLTAAPASAAPGDPYSIAFSSGDFGPVLAGANKQLVVTFVNDGTQPITIAPAMNLSSIPAPFAFVSASITATDVLMPGATADFTFKYTAGTAGTTPSTKVTFKAESTITPGFFTPYDLTLMGTSIATTADYTVTDPPAGDTLDFGSVAVGSSATKTITVSNTGAKSLTFDSSDLSVRDLMGNAVPLAFIGAPFSTVVAPGTTATFPIEFVPTAEVRTDGFVTLVGYDGTNGVTKVVEFTALGTTAITPTTSPSPSPSSIPMPGRNGTGTGAETSGRTLASTGIDSASLFAGSSVALMLVVGGTVALVQRRRRAKA